MNNLPSDYPPDDEQYLSAPPPGSRLERVRPALPVVTYTLMGITIVIYLLQMASESLLGLDYPAALGLKVNDYIIAGQVWRLITPMLLHGSILHIAFNMYALYSLGPGLEHYYGRGRYLALYLISAFGGNVLSFLFSAAPSLGASTAIFGLLGAEGVFLYRNREVLGPRAQNALINVVIIAAVNLMMGLNPGIDNWGHVGGLIAGTTFAWFAGPSFRAEHSPFGSVLVQETNVSATVRVALAIWAVLSVLAGLKIFLAG